MAKDSASIAASEATTLVDDGKPQEERTTITGKPLKYQHDSLSGTVLGDGGGFASGVGANHLPPGYTDQSRVRVPIKWSDAGGKPSDASEVKPEKKRGLLGKLSRRREDEEDFVVVMMSRGDYLKYWAKDERGEFLPSVVEPPEGRGEWLRRQLELNEEMKRRDPSLGKQKGVGFDSSKALPGAIGVLGGSG